MVVFFYVIMGFIGKRRNERKNDAMTVENDAINKKMTQLFSK